MELYLRIGALMEKHGFTNQSMADLSGIPLGTVSSIRSGKIQNPSFETVCAMMQAMGVPVEELLYPADTSSANVEPAQKIFTDQQQLIMQQGATVAVQAAKLEARDENITRYQQRISDLEKDLHTERRRNQRMERVLLLLVSVTICLFILYIWDVQNLHSGLTAYFNP